ncbi:MAG: Trk system potassium transporter TrkA [Alphaproteobacteria bacterium]|nr:Trk system potassium transporter TrkA [Alphaproteobacteria bacterium]
MKIVVGGASNVGKSIVGYLSMGNNDIVVVDEDAARLDEIAKEYDIQPVLGSISHPDIQENIGMHHMDMLIAVTENDEINMVACQVAYTLFNVPLKIARVDSEYFLNPLWNTLYNEKSLPIDLVITPDVEIGKFMENLLKFPGTTAVYPFLNGAVNIFAFRHLDTDIPFMKFSLKHINQKLSELDADIVLIIRGGRRIIPKQEEDIYLQRNDMIYVCCKTEMNLDVLRLFGVDHNPYEKIVIFGANPASYYLASQIEQNDSADSCRIIEQDAQTAAKMAEKLRTTAVISGDIMSDVILQDAGFATADASIAVTEKDKDNLLISLLASKNKDTQAFSLVNSKDYNIMALNIKNNVIIDRAVITVSALLRHLRKARIYEAYSLGIDTGEIWEINLNDDSVNIGHKVKDLNIPKDSSVMVVCGNDKLVFDVASYQLKPHDKIIVFVAPNDIRRIENIFYL